MFFRRRPKTRPEGMRLTRDQSFNARPIATEVLDRRARENGGALIVIPMRPTGYQKWLLRISEGAQRTIELDAVGVEVFDMCDGRTSVRKIARTFAREHQVDQHEAEMAVASFVQMMMRKGLVSVMVDRGRHEGTKARRHEG